MHLPASVSQHHWLSAFLPPSEPVLTVPAEPISLRILFPAGHDWEEDIRAGFAASRHKIVFADFTQDNISRYDLVVPLSIADLGCSMSCAR